MSKHANLIYECITYYIYAYQLRCPKQDVLRTLVKTLYTFATEAKHTSLYALLLKAASMLLLARCLAEF